MRLRALPFFFLLAWSGLVHAQSVTVTNFIRISFQHHAWGLPGQVWAGLLPSDPEGVGTITVTTTAGDKGQWIIQAMEFIGAGTKTWLNVSIADGANNTVSFYDGSATLNPEGRTGVFTQVSGTGAFHTATSSISYTFACVDPNPGQCNTGSANPATTDFLSSFSASGTLTATITNQPPPPPDPVVITPKGHTVAVPQAIGSARTVTKHHDTSTNSGGPDGSMIITIPAQFAAVSYSATAACANLTAGCWLSLPPPTTGALAAFTSGSLVASLDFGTLPAGVYPADVSVAVTAADGSIPPATETSAATLVVNAAPPLELSESAVAFETNAGAVSQLLHSIALSSSGSLTYEATASTLTGGDWLSVAPASGATPSSGSASMAILASPAGLAAGTYFGRVDINAPGALTVWQSIEVALTILPPAAAPPIFSTTGLIFVAPHGSYPDAQDLLVSTFSNQPITITAGTDDNELAWLAVDASSTTLQSGQPIKQAVRVGNLTLAPGVYPGSILESVNSLENPIPVIYIVTPSSGNCTPTQLVPIFTTLYSGFEFPAGLPVSVQAQIVDDCGTQLNSGTVLVNFGPGDPSVTMASLGNGLWSGTWLPHGTAPGPAAVGISAQSAAGLQGSTSVTGTIDANTTLPLVTPEGILNAANPVLGAPLAPGEFISIYGSNFAPTPAGSGSPLPTSLGGTQVLLGGQPLPIYFVNSGLINAVVPFETPVNAIQELLISQNGAYSLPENVVVANAAPAIFTQSENGQGAGVIVVFKANGTVYETSPTQPASAGDLLLIYCDGLGAVSPAVADGAAAPTSAPFATTVNPVTATIGGQAAQVQFAGLAPGYSGVYQVNLIVPEGVASGPAVPVILTVAGFSSSPATVTIQ